MCGIFGIFNLAGSQKFIDGNLVKESSLQMQHRGPDAYGQWGLSGKIELAHLRLSIIDVRPESNQPFFSDDKNYALVFNGEIFNYLELRNELIASGHTFTTGSDTEVLLKSYLEWGPNCVSRFNGDWAFAIYNQIENELFCSRDRYGVKPFNYAIVNDQFVFSSEIKPILKYFPSLKEPNINLIANFCRTSIGAQTKETWFNDIFRLEPGCNITINRSGLDFSRYWDYPKLTQNKKGFLEATDDIKTLLRDAAVIRMRSDVPIGFTLSSGIDSSSLVSLLESEYGGNKQTYTAAFSNTNYDDKEKQNFRNNIEINEPRLVRKLTSELGLNSTIIEIDFDDYLKTLQKIIYHLESGHGSPAIFPLYEILKVASKDVTVVLEGQGADELLGGYISSVFPWYLRHLIQKGEYLKAFTELKIFAKDYSIKQAFMLYIRQSDYRFIKQIYYNISGIEKYFTGDIKKYSEIKDYPRGAAGFDNIVNEHLYKSHIGGLANLLHYGDAISMAHSLESRLPFLDYRLVEYVFSLPPEHKVNSGMGKYILRSAMQNVVPDYIINNPIKFGFDSPLSHLFSLEGANSAKSILLSQKCLSRGLFSERMLNKAFQDLQRGKKNPSRILFRMLQVELWFREFIDG